MHINKSILSHIININKITPINEIIDPVLESKSPAFHVCSLPLNYSFNFCMYVLIMLCPFKSKVLHEYYRWNC